MDIATWNINSVRLRMPIVEKFVREYNPDVLCLQETKCRDSEFPLSDFERLGYPHIAISGQKGYHGVCTVSRLPFHATANREFCKKGDCRHLTVTFAKGIAGASELTIHNFYVPAGGDEPDPLINPKFAHKLEFLDEMADWMKSDLLAKGEAVILGDLNIAPLVTDVWSHKALLKVVSHTPIEVEKLGLVQAAGPWDDAIRTLKPEPEKVFTWWSYRSPDWANADKGRRLDHIWTSRKLTKRLRQIRIIREARGWDRPSDHVPVIMTIE